MVRPNLEGHLRAWGHLHALLLLIVPSVALALEEELIIVSPHWEGIQREFERGFGEYALRNFGKKVKVEWLDVGGTSEVLRFVKSEFSKRPEGIGIDVIFGGGIDPYIELSRLGLLQPYRLPDSLLSRIAPEIGGIPIYDPKYRWYGATLAGFGIIYNRAVLKLLGLPEPKTWEDLGDPSLFSWVGSADPRSSGSVHMAYEIILQAYGWRKGWEVITRMGGNVRAFTRGANESVKDVAAGEVAYGLAIDFYAWAQVNRIGPDKIGYVMPEGLTVVNPDAVAILKGAPHPEAARRFLEFVMSEEGQRLWMCRKGVPGGPREYQLGRFSVLPDLYGKLKGLTAVSANPFSMGSSLEYDADKGSERWRVLNDMVGALIIDVHVDLVRAWRAVIGRGLREEEVELLCRPPVSEEEALRLADRWDDPEFRNERIAEWRTFARKKYEKLGGRPEPDRWGRIATVLALGMWVAFVLPYMQRSFKRRRLR
ncbi:MAG: hypothetical protein DRP94_04015 [Candidatus Latescibacterota bacterium]|nr:MAG: hypothetical protein DRP94_04015 [Candidatus Latescibacterota bacterium]